MEENSVDIKHRDAIAVLTFTGQGELNLLGPDLILNLHKALEEIEADTGVRVVVLRGQGERAFSGGVNVRKMKTFSPKEAEDFILRLHGVMRKIMLLKHPVVASIVGPCLGGALELVLACDLRIASEDALFGLPEIRVGIPSVIEASLLSRAIGWNKARELILTGDIIDADESFRLGLVNRIAPRASMEQKTGDMAKRFLNLSPLIMSIQKDIMDKWLNLGHDQGAEYSAKAFALCFTTDHPREGMEAFLEKREPVYQPIHNPIHKS